MALPSSVILASAGFVVAASAGLVVMASSAAAESTDTPAGSSVVSQAVAVAGERKVRPPVQEPRVAGEPARGGSPGRRHDAVPKVFVEVYNNSGVSGLAATKARVLEGAGWNVAATDNWYGDIPATTVYYPPKLEAEAKRLAKLLDVTRLRPAVSPMRFDRLTVIFTSP